MENQDKIAHWRVLFKEHKESRLSLTEFCAKKQVKRPTYHYWKKRIIELNQESKEDIKLCSRDYVSSKTNKRASIYMLSVLIDHTEHIYLAIGVTDL